MTNYYYTRVFLDCQVFIKENGFLRKNLCKRNNSAFQFSSIRWAKYNMDVCGPVALDLAVSEEACHHKHYTAPGAGKADILLVPNYEVGNGIGKAANLFGNAKNAGIILGAKVPIVLVSRADSAYSKLASIAAGSVLAARMDLH